MYVLVEHVLLHIHSNNMNVLTHATCCTHNHNSMLTYHCLIVRVSDVYVALWFLTDKVMCVP